MGTNTAGSLRHYLKLKEGQTGAYTIFVRYTCATKAGNIKLTVNGNSQTVKCEKTANNQWRLVSVKATLKEGQNTFIITNTGALPMYIDQVIYQPDDVEPMKYAINVSSAANGTVTSDLSEAAEGDTVTLSVQPASGYKLKELRLTNSVFFTIPKTIPVTEGATEVKFVMIHDNMTIKPVFERGTSGINPIEAKSRMPEGIYSPSGVRRQELQRGLNIMKTADGKMRKVYVP
jgi:hypothetical protein